MSWTVKYYDDTGWAIYIEDGRPLQPTLRNRSLLAAAPALFSACQYLSDDAYRADGAMGEIIISNEALARIRDAIAHVWGVD